MESSSPIDFWIGDLVGVSFGEKPVNYPGYKIVDRDTITGVWKIQCLDFPFILFDALSEEMYFVERPMQNKELLTPYDPKDFLDSPEIIGHYLWEAAQEAGTDTLHAALADVCCVLERMNEERFA